MELLFNGHNAHANVQNISADAATLRRGPLPYGMGLLSGAADKQHRASGHIFLISDDIYGCNARLLALKRHPVVRAHSMQRDYDIFEEFTDGAPIWRGHASDLENACTKLEAIASNTTNECFAIHLPTKEIVARVNVGPVSAPRRKRLIFQIAYDGKVATERAQLLRACGYEVVSVIGNEAAKVVLSMSRTWDLFIVGPSPSQGEGEIVRWLKVKYPGIRVLALNSPGIRDLPDADYNIRSSSAESWLPTVATALGLA
jgi:hypothetical protein